MHYYKSDLMIVIAMLLTQGQSFAQVVASEKLIQERQKKIHFQSLALEKEQALEYAKKLFKAIAQGSVDDVHALIQDGLRVASFINIQNSEGQSALIFALAVMKDKLSQAYIGASQKIREKKRITRESPVFPVDNPRIELVRQRYGRIIKSLVEAGADVNLQDAQGWTALMRAIAFGLQQIVDQLLALPNLNLNLQDTAGDTALMKAVYYEQPETVKKMIQAHAALDLQNKVGSTALMIAAKNNFFDSFKLLLAAGADLSKKDIYGETVLSFATEVGDDDIVKMVEEAQAAPLLASMPRGKSPLRLRMEAAARAEEEKKRAASTVTPSSEQASPSPSPVLVSPAPSPSSSGTERKLSTRSVSSSPYRPSTPSIPEE